MTELGVLGNIGEEIQIGDKLYKISSPTIGVAGLVSKKLKELLDLMQFDPTKQNPDEVTLDKLVRLLIQGVWNLVMQQNEKTIEIITDILALLINNKPLTAESLVITPEEIKWSLELKDFTPFLIRLFKMADVSDFLLILLRTAQSYDAEEILPRS